MRPDWGIEGDAHAGNWHRQVSLLAQESVERLQQLLTKIRLRPGDFGENIVTEGIVLYELPVGTKMRIGTALAEVTQIGKECHQGCAIRQAAGDCVMPRKEFSSGSWNPAPRRKAMSSSCFRIVRKRKTVAQTIVLL